MSNIPRIKKGKTTITTGITPGINKEVQITFDTPFSVAPTVVVTPNTARSDVVQFSVGYVYTTGFRIIFTNTETISIGFEWIAVGS